jgi:ankyrin repeat protein
MNTCTLSAVLLAITFFIGGCVSTSPHFAIKKGDMHALESIINKQGNVEQSTNGSDSLLITAVSENKPDIVRYLLQHGAMIDYANRNGVTPLIGAAIKGHTEIAKLLIEKGARLDMQSQSGDTALTLAVDKGQTEIAKLLIEKSAKLDVQNKNGNTTLIIAAVKGNTELVTLLVEKGAKLDVQNQYGNTALILAVDKGNTEIVRQLTEKGAKLDAQNKNNGDTALTLAVWKDHTEIAKLLIAKGAKLDVQNKGGYTALILVVDKGHTELAKLLVDKGAKLDMENQLGNTALILAVDRGHTEIAKLLIGKSAMLNGQNKDGDTALIIAAVEGNTELAKLLIEKGAMLDVQNQYGDTALTLAVDKDHTETAKLLIEKGAKLDVRNKNGVTALILAADNGNIRLVVELLKRGADPLLGPNGKTPSDFARSAGHSEIVAILDQAIQKAIGPKVKSRKEGGAISPNVPKKTEIRVTSTGTGFIVSKAGHVLTNHHVVNGCKEVRAQIPAGDVAVTPVVARDPRNDLALLKLSSPLTMSTATFRDGQIVRQGDSVVAVGFPLHGVLASGANLTTGTVSALAGLGDDTRFLQISAPVQPGNSGGPLLDLSGNVVGIVVSKLDAIRVAKAIGDIPQNVNFAINATVARGFLDAKGVKYETTPSNRKLEAADVGELAKKFTVVVECWK